MHPIHNSITGQMELRTQYNLAITLYPVAPLFENIPFASAIFCNSS